MGRLSNGVDELVQWVDHRVGWHKLPRPLSVYALIRMRGRLRERNLYDTGLPSSLSMPADRDGDVARHQSGREADGTYTDLEHPLMGSTGTRFGRNVPLEYSHAEEPPRLFDPNPRKVSLELMTREEFQPATTLNVLAAVWTQFEVHDWFSHGRNDAEEPYAIPLGDTDDWPERPMNVLRTTRDATSPADGARTWITADTHWWDASQLYGRTNEFVQRARAHEDGKLRVDPDGMLPADLEEGADLSDVAGNNWVALSVLHTLFTLEHNAICDRLRAEYPTWGDDRLYDKARLINGALMAKIHTVDWTPALLAHPTTKLGMHAQWWGLASERVNRMFGRISKSEVWSGIPGSPTDHHGVPYSLTEEFVTVYRMHPLIPDEYTFRGLDDQVIAELTFPEINAMHTHERLGEITMPNALYSLGVAYPGAVTLHNFPRFLQQFDRPDGAIMDLAAVDILRTRERGVPRYTKFRELLHRKPVRSFADITDNQQWMEELRAVYDDDVHKVDTVIGLFAEPLPRGFAFSDTAFRLFILMASRRLKSDRFFTVDYTPEMYTRAGLEWVRDNDMRSVLLRHFPQLAPSLEGVENPFAPWQRLRARSSSSAAVGAVGARSSV